MLGNRQKSVASERQAGEAGAQELEHTWSM